MLAPMTTLLVGHRGTGKTTLAAALGRLYPQLEIVDLDAQIEQHHGTSCAALIARSMDDFRAAERDTLLSLLKRSPKHPRVIVLGAGCPIIPPGPLCIWLWRKNWATTALDERERLWPSLTPAQEIEQMRATREPRWADAAHLKLDLEPGAPADYDARRLGRLIAWAHQAREHVNTSRTWIVPTDHAQLERATADTQHLGFAGVELRSDLFPQPPTPLPVRWLASLRHDDPRWLTQYAQDAQAIDLDLNTLEHTLEQRTLHELRPRRLLLSSHALAHSLDAWQQLLDAANDLAARCPQWAPHLELKYAPVIASWDELEALLVEVHQGLSPYPLTLLPQGQSWAWTRPLLLATGNTSNYIPARLSDWRLPSGQPPAQAPSPYDYQSWLPMMAGPQPMRFDALIGQPVRYSAGDELHREAALNEPEQADRGYLKIPLPATMTVAQLDQALRLFEHLGLRGLSVTSPHKRLLPQSSLVHNPDALKAANTLTLSAQGWLLHDTDHVGMRASLEALEAKGLTPGTVAIFGQGGVSHALLDAIARSKWRLIHHASAREGWSAQAPQQVALIINASGDSDSAYLNPPSSLAWIDLHYNHVRPAPDAPQTRIHLNGMIFFKAQAFAQRALWARDGLDL